MISGRGPAAHFDQRDITDPDAAAFQIMSSAAGWWFPLLLLWCIGGMFSAPRSPPQVGVTWICTPRGCDGAPPPKVFGKSSARFNTPVGATVFVAVISLSALVADLYVIATPISFGVRRAFSMVNLAVAKYFAFDAERVRGVKGGAGRVAILLPLGFALTMPVWFNLSAPALITGTCWVTIGLIYLAGLTRLFRRQPPEVQFDPPPARSDDLQIA